MPFRTVSLGDLNGRRVDMLGRVQPVGLNTADIGVQKLIFQTNDMDFRGSNIYVAFVTFDVGTLDAQGNFVLAGPTVIPADVQFNIGSNGTSDWATGAITITGFVTPIVFRCFTAEPPVYGPGIPFTAVLTQAPAAPWAFYGQVSAYGWAFG